MAIFLRLNLKRFPKELGQLSFVVAFCVGIIPHNSNIFSPGYKKFG
jgi:hypothetical protein